ncbi:hypothetical protein [Dyella sp. 20L07]|uniref:hypothetical protein n=1 Tax=Dyella sp. 20L07 TaxID=3384240 RepID=UPI003D273B58
MFLKVRCDGARAEGFSAWRIVVWLMLLLAAFGCLQYVTHAGKIWEAMHGESAGDPEMVSRLRGLLAWDLGYFAGAFAVIVICAGAILRQAWARPALQVAAVLLSLWALLSAGALLVQWHDFQQALDMQMGQGQAPVLPLERMRRNLELAVAFKAVSVIVLLWLARRLAHPSVRSQFRGRRSSL